MFYSKIHEQTILEVSQGDYVSATADSFLIDRQAKELSRHTPKFYREFLRTFIEHCNPNSLRFIQEITPDFLAPKRICLLLKACLFRNLQRHRRQQAMQFVLSLRMGDGQNKSPFPEQSVPGLLQDHLVIIVHRLSKLLLVGRKIADDLAKRFWAAVLQQLLQAVFAFQPVLRERLTRAG
jgi:hypothetical protein